MPHRYLSFILLLLLFTSSCFSSEKNKDLTKWIYIPDYARLTNDEVISAVADNDVLSFTGVFISRDGDIRFNKNNLLNTILQTAADKGRTVYPLIAFENAASGKRILNCRDIIVYFAEKP